jgi:GNAT superfamily N-acetyltransferase
MVSRMSVIRQAELRDLPGIYRVCLQTGDSGEDATALFRDPDLLGHIYTGPYVVGEPDLAFVVADELGVGGYTLGTSDSDSFAAWEEAGWWPSLRRQYPRVDRSGAAAGDAEFHDAELIDLLFTPPSAPPALVADFPAEMHIDLAERMRGHGHGRALIEALIDRLRERHVPGLHLDVSSSNDNAIAFYMHLGFVELHRVDTSVFMGLRLK